MMKTIKTIAAITLIISVGFVSCGKNPFGPGGAGGLNIFSKIAKAMSKPSAINEKEQGKEGSKAVATQGVAAAKRLAKSVAGGALPEGVIHNGITKNGGDTVTYYEDVLNKPDKQDSQKLATGTGEVKFKYIGSLPVNPSLTDLDTNVISDIYSWHFQGREEKEWNGEIDSIIATVNFSSGNIHSPSTIRPGKTEIWGKNISFTLEQGKDDTAYFALNQLDSVNYIQYGNGSFYDAHTGKENSEPGKAFNFTVQVLFNTKYKAAGTNPYLDYDNNVGTMNFYFPWGKTGDSLYFTINFYPYSEDSDLKRDGDIRKNSPTGPVLVKFTCYDKKPERNIITYYYENGKEVPQ